MKSHHNNRAGLLAALAIVLGLAAMPQMASAGIVSTKHNLGTGGTASTHVTTAGVGDLCVFCHTPHGGVSGSATLPPLWNKGISTGTTYTVYNTTVSSTIDGKVVGGTSLTGSPSLACLTCHDGTQAMDNMINAPGSGGYTAGGASQGYTWTGNTSGGKLTQGAGLMNLLGTDLSNDHPIAIQYCGGSTMAANAGGTTKVGLAPSNESTCADQDFEGPSASTAGSNLLSGLANGVGVFWLETAGSVTANGRDKKDLPLYTSAADGPTVECGSCHDPHSDAQATFLRTTNANSALCLACHVK